MEVHSHTHTPRKKWTHYFWEFLMLFLAVFSGFLAEYQLEHKIERDREKQFITSLVGDIKADNEIIDNLKPEWFIKFLQADSLMKALGGKEIIHDSYPAYRLWGLARGFKDFIPHNGTIKQLINSGGLRLIHNRNVADSIMSYERMTDILMAYQAQLNSYQTTDQGYLKIFDEIKIFNTAEKENIPLLINDSKSLNLAFSNVRIWSFRYSLLIKYAENVQTTGASLLQAIQKEYNLK
jgi:hypothetical protein